MSDLGYTDYMGPILRHEVEKQLIADLAEYGFTLAKFQFDWSGSCIEGHRVKFLDGYIENWSGICVVDTNTEVTFEGWIDFIFDPELSVFRVYWDLLGVTGKKIKADLGIPVHVWSQLPDQTRLKCKESKYYKFAFNKMKLP
ncbi:hypothetical protein L6Q79_16025 [bacterium]|nr:hypothetical protein [bacterium]